MPVEMRLQRRKCTVCTKDQNMAKVEGEKQAFQALICTERSKVILSLCTYSIFLLPRASVRSLLPAGARQHRVDQSQTAGTCWGWPTLRS